VVSKDMNRRMYFIIISAKVHVTQHSESTLTDTHVHLFNLLTYLMKVFIEIFSPKIVLFTINLIQGLSWWWSYGTDIYLYNQCLNHDVRSSYSTQGKNCFCLFFYFLPQLTQRVMWGIVIVSLYMLSSVNFCTLIFLRCGSHWLIYNPSHIKCALDRSVTSTAHCNTKTQVLIDCTSDETLLTSANRVIKRFP
jgi:hypothetical protein